MHVYQSPFINPSLPSKNYYAWKFRLQLRQIPETPKYERIERPISGRKRHLFYVTKSSDAVDTENTSKIHRFYNFAIKVYTLIALNLLIVSCVMKLALPHFEVNS